MASTKHKLRVAGTFAALIALALAASCRGFFQNPVLSSLAIGPASPTIETGSTANTVQMTVTGTNNDGSEAENPSVSWSITPTTVATVSSTGLVTSVSTGTATVTATSNQNASLSATATVTVTVGCITSITLSTYSGDVTTNSPSLQINATAVTCNGSDDVTAVATWTSSNTSLATVSAGDVEIVPGLATGGTVTVTASIGSVSSTAATISVSP
ncbi:MAG: Ig-like domain-containing protein [Candidatus Sulfotelmatobacter sp.]